MARKATVIGTSKDLIGRWWDVREARPTTHGFDLLFGWPQAADGSPQRGKGAGGPRIVPTRALYRYWRGCRIQRDGSIYDLPAGRSALKRVRQQLRYNDYAAHSAWWDERVGDLQTLTLQAFARKHGVHISQASVARRDRAQSSPS